MMQCLLNKNATVTICHSKTIKLDRVTKKADILVVAIGKSNFITKEMVKEGAIVIDVGINRGEDGKLYDSINKTNIGTERKGISLSSGAF